MSDEKKSPADIAAEKLALKQSTIRAYHRIFAGSDKPNSDAFLVLEDLRKRSFYDWPTRTAPGQPDFFRDQHEGMRMLFLHIKSKMKADPTKTNLTPEDF